MKNIFKKLFLKLVMFSQFSSVAQSCPTLCDPMNHSSPGLPVHHQLLEFTQTHVHQVGDAIQPSHSLSSPSPPAPNPSQSPSLPVSQLLVMLGSYNRKKESRMAVAKRQGREKPVKIEQRKVQGPE